MKKAVVAVALAALMMLTAGYAGYRVATESQYTGNDTATVRVDSVRDTVVVVVRDTAPSVRRERVVAYVKVNGGDAAGTAAGSDSIGGSGSGSDSLRLAVVQREYSDSSYTAYVSGVRYGDWPKLDSIIVRRQMVTNTINRTVTVRQRRSRWSVGLQAGYGYGVRYGGLEPYVGVGVGYALFPP